MDESNRVICLREALVDGGRAVRFEWVSNPRKVPCFVIAHKGQVHAWQNTCPHKGTELDWQPGEVFDADGKYLICATHGALFEPDTGLCVAGPCVGAKLRAIPVVVEQGSVRLQDGNANVALSILAPQISRNDSLK